MVNAGLGIQYDAAGNQTAIGGFSFTYDAESRLVSSTLNGVTATYAYDGEGRRVKKGAVAEGKGATLEKRNCRTGSRTR